MLSFFRTSNSNVIAVEHFNSFTTEDINKLCWLFSDAVCCQTDVLEGIFVGPRREMITPWSTNAVEITQNMGINGISRIE